MIVHDTPLKINMEPDNEALEDDEFLFKQVIFRFRLCSMVKSRVFWGMGDLPPLMTESL